MADDALTILQSNVLQVLRGDPTLAALVHATAADVASRTALKAVTGMADGDIRLVDEVVSDVVTFVGLYLYDDDNANADDNDTYIEPTVGSGAWVRQTVDSLTWALDPSLGGHVFVGHSELMHGGRNRGRMPFLEVDFGGFEMEDLTTDSGLMEIPVLVRGWYANFGSNAAYDELRKMMLRVARAIKNWRFDASNVGYEPGQAQSGYQRLYQDCRVSVPEVERISAAIYADLTCTVGLSYAESDLR